MIGSVRAKLAGTFLLLFLISAAFIYLSHFYTDNFLLSDYRYLVKDLESSRQLCIKMERSLRHTTYSLELFEQTGNPFYSENRMREWEVAIKPTQNELFVKSASWRNKTSASLIYSLAIRCNHLFNAQNSLENKLKKDKTAIPQQERDRLYTVAADADEILNLILNDQKLEIEKLYNASEHHKRLMWWLFTPLYLLITLLVSVFALAFIRREVKGSSQKLLDFVISLNQGNLPEPLPETKFELSDINVSLNKLKIQLEALRAFSLEIGKENFDADFQAFESGSDMDLAFLQMRDSLKLLESRDQEVAWSVGGVAHFATVLRQNTSDLSSLCNVFASEAAKYLNAQQLILYLADLEAEEVVELQAQAFYAQQRRKYIQEKVEIGIGVVGQCLYEKQPILLKNIPSHYVRVQSGLGEALPKLLLLLPLMAGERLVGVLELGTFKELKPHEVEFAMKIGESFASTVLATSALQRTQNLLQFAQKAAESQAAQEEEMRRQMEELHEAQSVAASKELEITQYLHEAEEREKLLKENLAELNALREEIEAQKAEEITRMNANNQKQTQIMEKALKSFKNKELALKLRIKELEALLNQQK